MAKPLDGVRLKLRRADQRLAFLEAQRAALIRGKHSRVIGHFDANDEYVFRVPGRLPPLTWGLAVGEFAYYLRTALDNLLWQLVIARGGTPSTGRDGVRKVGTQFPIYEEKAEFDRKAHGSTIGALQTAGVLREDFTFIEALQPYHAGPDMAKWDPLALLGYLNNVDKHRYVHVAFASAGVIPMEGPEMGRIFLETYEADWPTRVRMPMTPNPQMGGRKVGLITLLAGTPVIPTDGSVSRDRLISYSASRSDDDPAEVYRIRGVHPLRANAKMEMGPGFLLDISFSDWKRPMTIVDLMAIRTTVDRIVAHFRVAIEQP